ncbi:XkdX family protein [Limosilactobacillus mucosae]|uniref:XkdX family protein n=1 Tax=Limosilactobacillus mucosae TaxID=97478 RepID=UPI001F58A20E|nr:XkdX family protein [Limosilactobacillus mucosae]
MMTEYDFVKQLYLWGFPIECYVVYRTITKDQYKEITGKDYVDASTSTSTGASESTSTDTSQA